MGYASLIAIALALQVTPVAADAGCGRAQIEVGRPLERTIVIEGVTRRYLVDVPETLTAGVAVPVLFDFHGWGHSADGVWRVSRFKEFSASESFITVYPDGLPVSLRPGQSRPGWQIDKIEGNRDIAFFRAMLAELQTSHCVDTKRIYSTGFSNGAYFSHVLACALPEQIAAIAPVGGGHITVPCAPTPAMPVLFHHGVADAIVPLARAREARDRWVEINGCSMKSEADSSGCVRHQGCRDQVEVVFCESEVAHTWPPEATRRIWDFVARYRRP